MSKLEFFVLLIVSIFFNFLFWLVLSKTLYCYSSFILTVMDILLSVFYVYYVKGKFDDRFYPHQRKESIRESKILIYMGVLFLISCGISSVFLFQGYLKWVGRVGLILYFFSVVVYFFYVSFKEGTDEGMWKCWINGIRFFMILLSNIVVYMFIIPMSDTKFEYDQSGKLIISEVDGFDSYETMYVDSLSNYITDIKKIIRQC